MRAAVIGLGVEGKKAFKSLIKHGWSVYACDKNINIDYSDLHLPLAGVKLDSNSKRMNIVTDNITLDLGYNNVDEVNQCDAIVVSPSMWKSDVAEIYKESGRLLCDVLDKHKDIYTIGVTGTNGKTTSVSMIKEILENSGKNVLVGGNGGGGFDGYYDLILEANEKADEIDVILVEVCDMTVEFCKYFFDFDIVALTNIGNDHMNVHGSIENYKNSLKKFFKDKQIVIDKNQIFNDEFKQIAKSTIEYDKTDFDLKLFGNFNKHNADLATKVSQAIKSDKIKPIKDLTIKNTLENFSPVLGRLDVLNLNDTKIYIGKSDNSDAIKPILKEEKFFACFIGTPRLNEKDRLDILNEVVKADPKYIIIFPGLEKTLDHCLSRLKELDYNGIVKTANNLDEIIEYVAEFSHEPAIFIGGNGQERIIEIQERLRKLSQRCN
ncbi:MAG: Mur ligase family protein [Methanobacteriaceae archaeon]|nr:Mur ligase family protein [Methanobacteriaceae archaeon]